MFIKGNELENCEIGVEQQRKLFEIEYSRIEANTRRLATKADVIESYGATDWDNLDPTIKEVLVDLRFRGDYVSSTRQFFQACVAENDLQAFTREIGDRSNWPSVPEDRFQRRKAWCDAAIGNTA